MRESTGWLSRAATSSRAAWRSRAGFCGPLRPPGRPPAGRARAWTDRLHRRYSPAQWAADDFGPAGPSIHQGAAAHGGRSSSGLDRRWQMTAREPAGCAPPADPGRASGRPRRLPPASTPPTGARSGADPPPRVAERPPGARL